MSTRTGEAEQSGVERLAAPVQIGLPEEEDAVPGKPDRQWQRRMDAGTRRLEALVAGRRGVALRRRQRRQLSQERRGGN